jgi:hypothetical protein
MIRMLLPVKGIDAQRSHCGSPSLLTDKIDYARMTEASICLGIVTTFEAAGYPECKDPTAHPLALLQAV